MSKKCILIIGGARSGKSQFALEMASSLDDKVLFVATGEPLDEEMRKRIEEHKKRRPSGWRTIEVLTGAGRRIKEEIRDARVVILDCLTLLVSNVMSRCGDAEQVDPKLVEDKLALEIKELIECIDGIDASCIIVSNEVGMGLVPENRLGRLYRGLLGKVNQELARHADEVCLMVTGIAINIKSLRKF